jgi:sugar/nucleoside kinase (ribokinase family)
MQHPRWYGKIVCVEDIPSAERLRRAGVVSVALLGCTPSDEALEELGTVARRNDYTVVFALDADASAQALRLQRKFSMRARSAVRFLEKDVKNMTPEELDTWLTNET